jgi:hypothetical protein
MDGIDYFVKIGHRKWGNGPGNVFVSGALQFATLRFKPEYIVRSFPGNISRYLEVLNQKQRLPDCDSHRTSLKSLS